MKLFKDPLYGYIEIEKDTVSTVVDSPEFQRLRFVRQTSYTPLFPTALYNRFVHSLGVFYLGKIAVKAIKDSLIELSKKEDKDDEIKNILEGSKWTDIESTFLIACLLHDVGHSPFSHTGEKFYYLKDGRKEPLFDELKGALQCDKFSSDFDELLTNTNATPHKVMNAIIGLEVFSSQIKDKELFARSIIGCPYTDANTPELQIKNILVSTLNSSCIDVDKLDCLIRDAYVTGYNTTELDYKRLLSSLRVIKREGGANTCFPQKCIKRP